MGLLPVLLLSSLAIVHGLPNTRVPAPSISIEWGPCPGNYTPSFNCAKFIVPLDYSDKTSIDLLELSLIKLNSTKKPFKGSVLFNPGGPGGSGLELIVASGAELSSVLGGQYDLIGFDPRGVGKTVPFSCYTSMADRISAAAGIPQSLNSSDTALGTVWAAEEVRADKCFENAQDIGELIGTPFVVRDMVQIIDALGEDGLLRYWGFSYGTILGATFAAMFPRKVDKLVLDGVANPHDYYSGFMKQGIIDADGTLAGFYSGCVATPERCALARHGSTAEGLANQINNLTKTVKYNPMPVKTEKGNGLITYEMVKSVIFQALYSPGNWIELSTHLHKLLTGNLTGFWDAYTAGDEGGDEHDDQEEEENTGTNANVGIRCGDAHILPPNNLDALKPELTRQEQMSKFAGDLWPSGLLDCARWKIHAKEQYSGNFHAKTKYPLLFVGNTHDPVTPYASAVNASAGFEGSVVLKHDAYGHCSIAQPSLCTSKAIQAYFVNGTVPAPGTVCQPTIQLFSNITAKEAFTSISLDGELEPEYDPLADDNNDVNIKKRDVGEDEDAELLAALIRLSKKISRFTGIY